MTMTMITETLSIPSWDQITRQTIGRDYLKQATEAAAVAIDGVNESTADLATVFSIVRESGVAVFAMSAADRKEAVKSASGRDTAFSLWYGQFPGMTKQEAGKLANFGDQLRRGLPVPNIGQSRAVTTAENLLKRNGVEDWQEASDKLVAEVYASGEATAAAIKQAAEAAVGIDPTDDTTEHNGRNESSDQRPTSVDTLADVVAYFGNVTAAAGKVSGDLSGISATEWKAFGRKLAAVAKLADNFGTAKLRKETATSV